MTQNQNDFRKNQNWVKSGKIDKGIIILPCTNCVEENNWVRNGNKWLNIISDNNLI